MGNKGTGNRGIEMGYRIVEDKYSENLRLE